MPPTPPLPTPTELLTLSAKALSPPPPVPCSHLSLLLTHLRPQWLRNFLLSPATHHLPALLSPTLPNRSFTATISTTQATALPYLDTYPATSLPDTHHINARILLTPTFSHDRTVGGIGIIASVCRQLVPTLLDTWEVSHAQTVPLRFVHNARIRCATKVFDIPHARLTKLHHVIAITPTRTCTITAIFRTDLLLPAITSATPDHPALLRALLSSTVDEQTHACKLCASPPPSSCACVYSQPDPPRHPFDDTIFRRSMAFSLGEYTSVAEKRFYAGGKPVGSVMLEALSALSGVADPAFANHAVAWAAERYMREVREAPWMSLCADTGSGGGSLHVAHAGTRREGLLPAGGVNAARGDRGELASDDANSTQPLDLGGKPVSADPDLMGFILGEDDTDRDWGSAPTEILSLGECRSDNSGGANPSSATTSTGGAGGMGRTVFPDDVDPLAASGKDTNVQTEVRSSAMESIAGMSERDRVAERRQKARLRRERNRAAARKSNLRRKENWERLTSEVRGIRERKNGLRRKEEALRRERI